MTQGLYWLHWVGAFLIVVGLLCVYVGVQEWLEWRKGR
jgi:hypothetical protein